MKLLIIIALLTPTLIFAAPGDENWSARWSLPGTDDDVNTILEFQGDLIIAGSFDFVGSVPAPGVARFDGTDWSALGDGVPGDVLCSAIYNGQLYVGGEFFDDDGGLGAMARWNGSTWEYDPFGSFYYVDKMLVHDGDLVILGDDGLMLWNGLFWDPLNTWDASYVADMTSDGANLYITGEFDIIDGALALGVARWDGVQWHGMGGGLGMSSPDDYAIGESIHAWDGKVAVAGYFDTVGGQHLPNFAVWDGSGWGHLGSSPTFFSGPTPPTILGDVQDQPYVFNGYGSVYGFNGFFWDTAGYVSYTGHVDCVGAFGQDLIFGGEFQEIDGIRAKNVASYDGTGSAWLPMAAGSGIYGDADQAHVWNGMLLVSGDPQTIFGDFSNAILAGWNGTDWADMGLGPQGSAIASIDHMVTYQGDLVVNGNIDSAGGTPCNSFARFDGTAWSPLGDAVTNSGGSGMVVLDGDLYAIVYVPGKVVAQYQPGSDSWLTIGEDPVGSDLYEMGTYQGDLIVAGSFPGIDGVAANRIARWDGTGWHPLGSGIEGTVRALHESDGKLYVAGSLTAAGGQPVNRIAVWDGTNWSPLGDGVYGRIEAMHSVGGDLYVTGAFSLSSGEPAADIAKWDGTAWSLLGSGLNDDGLALAEYAGELIVVGDFTAAGAGFSSGIASWALDTGTGVGDGPGVRAGTRLSMGPGRPNPFQNGTTFAFEMPRAGDAVMDVLDLRGRRVARRSLRGLAPGSHVIGWDGKAQDGREVPAGAYFVRMRAANVEAMRRVTLVR